MKDEYIKNFYDEVCKNLIGNYKIVLEPNRRLTENWVEYDTVEWKMEAELKNLVESLKNNKDFTLEEKIIKVYDFVCLKYIYDANVLYFFKKEGDKYIAVDWYGRIVENEWFEKRQSHNRRICYEFSRFYAKAINTLIDNNENAEAFILGDVENTHYVVGLSGENYSLILDQDDFNSTKDLTRLKMGLTIKGIHILKDEKGIFKKALEAFNKDRLEELPEIEEAKCNSDVKDTIKYLYKAIDAINRFNIDSQGFFECIRNLIESAGIKIEKIWKEDKKNCEKRYERCLYFEFENKTYLLDSIAKTLEVVDIDKLDTNLFIFNAEQNEYKYYGG